MQELVWNDPGLLEGNKKSVWWSNWRFYTCLFEWIKEDKIVSILYFSFKLIYVSTTSSNQWLKGAGEHLSLPYMTDVENRFYNK